MSRPPRGRPQPDLRLSSASLSNTDADADPDSISFKPAHAHVDGDSRAYTSPHPHANSDAFACPSNARSHASTADVHSVRHRSDLRADSTAWQDLRRCTMRASLLGSPRRSIEAVASSGPISTLATGRRV